MSDDSKWDFSVTWHIEDFSRCNLQFGERLASPVFTVDAFDNKKWCLSIYPRGDVEDSEGYVSCFLKSSEDNSSDEQDVNFKIEIKSADHLLYTEEVTQICIPRGKGRGLDTIKTLDLLSELKKCFSETLTIHCCVKKSHRDNTKGARKEFRTRITGHKLSFEWNVSLELLKNMKEKRYFFLDTTLYQIQIAISLDDVIVSVSKIGENSTSSDLIDEKITFLSVKGKAVFSKSYTYIFESKNVKEAWNFKPLISKKRLLEDISEYQKDGTVVLLCKFYLSKIIEPGTSMKPNSDGFAYLDGLINLSEDFRKLFVDKTNSDLMLRVDGNVEIRAHKSVLAARSPVFSAMFNCDMIENRASVVDIEDVDEICMERFLKFLYTGEVDDMNYEMASKLLMVAEKYQVSSLKEKCSLFLLYVLSVANVCEILVLADMFDREFLKKAVLNYAADNYMTIFPFARNAAWIREHVNLYLEILSILEEKYIMIPKVSPEK